MSTTTPDYMNMPLDGLTEPETTAAPEQETEAPEGAEQETEQESEGESEQESTTEEFKAWDLPKPKQPNHVPYERFQQVHTEREQFFRDATEMRSKISELEQTIEKLKQVPDPDDIDPTKFDTPQEYLAARDKAIAVKIRAEVAQDLAEREQVALQTQHLQQIGQRYEANLQEQAKEDPNVVKAKAFFDDYADLINPIAGRELLADPHVGRIMLRIATDKKLVQEFFQGSPDSQIRMINRLSARIDTERELKAKSAKAAPEALDLGDTDGKPAAPPQRRAPVPMQVKAGATGTRKFDIYKDADKMTLAQWRKARGL